jgi:hypothetical protein
MGTIQQKNVTLRKLLYRYSKNLKICIPLIHKYLYPIEKLNKILIILFKAHTFSPDQHRILALTAGNSITTHISGVKPQMHCISFRMTLKSKPHKSGVNFNVIERGSPEQSVTMDMFNGACHELHKATTSGEP